MGILMKCHGHNFQLGVMLHSSHQLQLEIVTAAVGSAAGQTYTESSSKICYVFTGSTGH